MGKRELALASLEGTVNSRGEGFHLQGVISVISLDPQMSPGVEIEIETTDPGTGQIDHRIQLTAQIFEAEGFTVAVLRTRIQQGLPGLAQSLQLSIQIAAECVDQQCAQIGCRALLQGGILIEFCQAEGAVAEPACAQPPHHGLTLERPIKPSLGIQGDLTGIGRQHFARDRVTTI